MAVKIIFRSRTKPRFFNEHVAMSFKKQSIVIRSRTSFNQTCVVSWVTVLIEH